MVQLNEIGQRMARLESKLNEDKTSVSSLEVQTQKLVEATSKAILVTDKEREDIKIRANNVIITGLPTPTDSKITDQKLVETFCEEALTVKPRILKTRRLGKDNVKICVTLNSPDDVKDLLSSAVILRSSSEVKFRQVYINRDLTRIQAEEAYKRRCAKRESRQPFPSASS